MGEYPVWLGDRVRDKVTGFEGIVTARYEYLNGCIRWEVSGVDKDGKPDGYAFDDMQVELLDKRVIQPLFERADATVQRPDPTRMTEVAPPGILQRLRTGGPRDNKPVPR